MKKALSLILAVMMLLGCMSITAFAAESIPEAYQNKAWTGTFKLQGGTETADFTAEIGTDSATVKFKDINLELPYSYKYSNSYCFCETGDIDNMIEFRVDRNDGVIKWITVVCPNEVVWGSQGDITPVLPNPNSGTTTIAGEITPADFGYTMVIPTATTLTESAHSDVQLGGNTGVASISDVKHGTADVNVYYTVAFSNGKKLTGDSGEMAATYTYKQGEADAATLATDTKVVVYQNATVTASKLFVSVADDVWNAAPSGTYTETVTFNFNKENALPDKITIQELLDTVTFPAGESYNSVPENAWVNSIGVKMFTYGESPAAYLTVLNSSTTESIDFPTHYELTRNGNTYSGTPNGAFWIATFTLDGGKLVSINMSHSSGAIRGLSGDFAPAN